MEYVLFNSISKRNIDQATSNENESFTLSNKRICDTEEVKFHLKDSRQKLKLHVNPEWNCTNKNFEHATNSESMNHIQAHRTKEIPIIFHFASEEIMDLENYGSTSIPSAVSFPISREKSSQSGQGRNHRMISNASLDRSLECLQANYREHLVRRKEDMKSSETIDAQAYVICRKHRQLIPVQIIASHSREKMCEFIQPNSLSQMRPNNTLSETRRRTYKQHRRKSFISDLS